MKNNILRHIIIVVILLLGLLWSLGSAFQQEKKYPNGQLITNAKWVKAHVNDSDIIIADVRSDDHFDGGLIPGAIRLPWSDFRFNDIGDGVASKFVGVEQARKVLGRHGITPKDTIVLYDSVDRDGGATASYLLWVLDILGHKNKKILVRGIDAWKEAGYDLSTTPREVEPLLYQAPLKDIQTDRLIAGDYVYRKLGDFYYQMVDVRSRQEYLGETGTKGIDGTPLKLGHIPTAVNISYQDAWTDPTSKDIKSHGQLQKLYAGLDPSKAVIVYCNSGRRSSFSYFVLRLMGFDRVYTYEASWKEWGDPDRFFPVETRENSLESDMLPNPSTSADTTSSRNSTVKSDQVNSSTAPSDRKNSKPSGGYISCGG